MQDLYVGQVRDAVSNKDAFKLSALFNPTISSKTYLTLRDALTGGPTLRPTSYTSLTRSFFPQYTPFADFLSTYLLFVRDADLFSDEAVAVGGAYQLAEDCFKAADKVFAQGETGWFVPTLRKLTKTLVALALKTGRLSGDANLTKASDAATLLRRPMTVASNDRGKELLPKRDALFFLANQTFKIYFALKNLRLCDTVLKNTEAAVGSLDKYPKADRVAFCYNKGRVFLYQRRLPQARQDLKKAFDMCHYTSSSNARLILIYLVAASLPLGIMPSEGLLEEYGLNEQYGQILPPLSLGDYGGVLSALDEYQVWHRQNGNYLLLKEKLEVICWRNLARRTLFVSNPDNRSPTSGPPTLPLQTLLITARVSFDDPSLDLDDIECMVASLCEQGYIKAYVMHSKRLLVLQKGPQVGFPQVSSVHPT